MKRVKKEWLHRDGNWIEGGAWWLIEDEPSLRKLCEDQFMGLLFFENKVQDLEEAGTLFVNDLGGYHAYNPEFHRYTIIEEVL